MGHRASRGSQVFLNRGERGDWGRPWAAIPKRKTNKKQLKLRIKIIMFRLRIHLCMHVDECVVIHSLKCIRISNTFQNGNVFGINLVYILNKWLFQLRLKTFLVKNRFYEINHIIQSWTECFMLVRTYQTLNCSDIRNMYIHKYEIKTKYTQQVIYDYLHHRVIKKTNWVYSILLFD